MKRSGWTGIGGFLLVGLSFTFVACTEALYLSPPDPGNPLPSGVSANPETFRTSIAGFSRGGSSKIRQRKAKCLFCTVQVQIEPIGNTLLVKPDSAPSPRPVARMLNLDASKVERFYRLDPGSQAEYYLWVDSIPGSARARITLLRVPFGGGGVTAGTSTNLNYCHYRSPADSAISDADFAEYKNHGHCDVPIPLPLVASRASTLSATIVTKLLRHLPPWVTSALRTEGGWIDCSNGCCT